MRVLKVIRHGLEFFLLGLMTLAFPSPTHFYVAMLLFTSLAMFHYYKVRDPYGFNQQ